MFGSEDGFRLRRPPGGGEQQIRLNFRGHSQDLGEVFVLQIASDVYEFVYVCVCFY